MPTRTSLKAAVLGLMLLPRQRRERVLRRPGRDGREGHAERAVPCARRVGPAPLSDAARVLPL